MSIRRRRKPHQMQGFTAPRQILDEALATAIPSFLNESGTANTPSFQQGTQANVHVGRVALDGALAGMKPKL